MANGSRRGSRGTKMCFLISAAYRASVRLSCSGMAVVTVDTASIWASSTLGGIRVSSPGYVRVSPRLLPFLRENFWVPLSSRLAREGLIVNRETRHLADPNRSPRFRSKQGKSGIPARVSGMSNAFARFPNCDGARFPPLRVHAAPDAAQHLCHAMVWKRLRRLRSLLSFEQAGQC
jgi:hypothetical protein